MLLTRLGTVEQIGMPCPQEPGLTVYKIPLEQPRAIFKAQTLKRLMPQLIRPAPTKPHHQILFIECYSQTLILILQAAVHIG